MLDAVMEKEYQATPEGRLAEPWASPEVAIRYASQDPDLTVEDYNFAHLRREHLLFDVKQTLYKAGIAPGELAVDFELPATDGRTVRLADLRDRPVVLRFGSAS